MKRIVFVFGSITGVLIGAWTVASIAYCYSVNNYEGSMLVGYAAMLLAFSLVFVGVKNYRDNHRGGIITFGKALQVGLAISMVASTIYVLTWLIDYYVFVPDFMEKFSAHLLQKGKDSGASAAEINRQAAELNSMKELYKNPIMVILFTYLEILPVGLVVSFLSALILKRKSPEEQLTV
ncbi:DUF4199 domain-containing protein [Daejeonella lutea]|uniref:DUF4199 domain-containing protein n=1 Tax=Daejeonella lutea TaxID=572036 RepID=A0A1T5A5H0_9SPHI|nr:DUF4199 domain-containing protein [Daejeonella lutea]SKB30272.1 Protein of unknown function [Daejeonella lutea]